MADEATICEELQSIIERHMMDVLRVESLEREPAMLVHLLDGKTFLVEVSYAGN